MAKLKERIEKVVESGKKSRGKTRKPYPSSKVEKPS